MPSDDFFYRQNEFVVGAVFLVTLLAAGELAHQLGRRRRRNQAPAPAIHLTEIQTAVFAVLGLLLAFSLAIALSRFDSRKQALVEETNAIGTAYLRTRLLPASEQASAVALFRRYTDLRIASARPGWNLNATLRRQTSGAQDELWSQATTAANLDPRSVSTSLYVQALNTMFDAQSSRDAARLNHLPLTGPLLIFAVSISAIGILGYRTRLEGGRSLVAEVTLALVLAAIVVTIIDLDHPYQGVVVISQDIITQLRQTMGP
jgi:predicted membrane protein